VTSVTFTVKVTDMPSKRILPLPEKSFFLFGPRATGKSTWLKNQVKPDFIVDLLKARDFQRYSTDLGYLREVIEANPKYKTIVIDEIQKLPGLLDEVHSLIFDYKDRLQFILTGSSARRLKTQNVNLLAGRAIVRHFHQFSRVEIPSQFKLDVCLKYGMLPEVWNLKTEEEKKDYLVSYVETYLKEEVQQEAAVRSLPSYLRFLEHFALRNAQVINLQNLSQEVGVARTTLTGYLDILEQTLLGFRLLPIHLKAKVKEVSKPKFYFFDTGIVRALSKTLDDDFRDEHGQLLETYILHELRTFCDYFQPRAVIHYWGTPGENEVDFILSKGKDFIGIEVKSSKNWSNEFSFGLKTLLDAGKIRKAIGVYQGKDILKKGEIMIYPLQDFVELLFARKIF
jgi:predicted AAA+ superfamily ATPase